MPFSPDQVQELAVAVATAIAAAAGVGHFAGKRAAGSQLESADSGLTALTARLDGKDGIESHLARLDERVTRTERDYRDLSGNLAIEVRRLEDVMDRGFSGVHRRLDDLGAYPQRRRRDDRGGQEGT
jgi:hypothetical protein